MSRLARYILVLVFGASGLAKLVLPSDPISVFGSLPAWVKGITIAVELGVALMLAMNRGVWVASGVIVVMLAVFCGVLGAELTRQTPRSCGCFAGAGGESQMVKTLSDVRQGIWWGLTRNVCLALGALYILRRSGNGMVTGSGVVNGGGLSAACLVLLTASWVQAGDAPSGPVALPESSVFATVEGSRDAATQLSRDRRLDLMLQQGQAETVANLAMKCINAQPDRIDRLDYFFQIRIRALLAAKRAQEALATAKSYYNVCLIGSTGRAIDLVGECLDALHPDQPQIAKRWRLQQLEGGVVSSEAPVATPEGGESVLKSVKVEEKAFSEDALPLIRQKEWRMMGQVNLLLMRDQPEKAGPLVERLAQSANQEVREAARESRARISKARLGRVGPANVMLEAKEGGK